MTYRLLVTGSRDWDDEDTIRRALMGIGALVHKFQQRDRVVVVHGGARGADRIAGRIAAELGMEVETHPADWERHGKRAGFVRNAEMVDSDIDSCVAFIKNGSRGATMCVELAEKKGIHVTRYVA